MPLNNRTIGNINTAYFKNPSKRSIDFRCEIQDLQPGCQKLLQRLNEFELPVFKPRWCDLTDAGLGLGVSNFEVRFRDAELSRIWNSDYRIRVHRAREDSSQGEAERTNAAVGDAVIDGRSIKWEYFPRFHDKSDEEIEKMTLKDYEKHEDERIERNAWRVVNEIALRIDDALVLSDYIYKVFVTEKDMDAFFFNRSRLLYFIKAPNNSKRSLPCYNYFVKICDFLVIFMISENYTWSLSRMPAY